MKEIFYHKLWKLIKSNTEQDIMSIFNTTVKSYII